MAASTEVIREYLTKVGYVTDAVSQKRTEAGMVGMKKKVLAVGGAVAGLVASVGAATAAFAYSMRKMYYQSELSNNSVKNIQGVGYAMQTVGIDADRFNGIVTDLAQNLRYKPGYQQFIESLGVKVKGRETIDVLMDIIKTIKKMPKEAQAPTAGFLGIDLETLFMVGKHMDEINAKRREMSKMQKDMGVDPDAAKKTLMEYTQALDKLEARMTTLGQKALIAFSGPFKEAAVYMNQLIDGWSDFLSSVIGGKAGEDWKLFQESAGKDALAAWREYTGINMVKRLFEDEKKASPRASATVTDALAAEFNIPELADLEKKPQKPAMKSTQPSKLGLGTNEAVFGVGAGAMLGTQTTNNNTVVHQTIEMNVTGVKDSQDLLNKGGAQVREALNPWTARNMRGAHK